MLDQQAGSLTSEKEQLQLDLQSLLEYKSEIDNLVEQLKIKLDRKKAKETYFKETLAYREQELEKKELVLRKVSMSAEDAQKQLKTTGLRLRQLEHT